MLKAGPALGSDRLPRTLCIWVFMPYKDRDLLGCPQSEKALLYVLSEPLLFQLTWVIPCPPAMLHCDESGRHLDMVPIGTGGLLLVTPKVFPSPNWSSTASPAFPHRASGPAVTILVSPAEIPPVRQCLSCTREDQNWMQCDLLVRLFKRSAGLQVRQNYVNYIS